MAKTIEKDILKRQVDKIEYFFNYFLTDPLTTNNAIYRDSLTLIYLFFNQLVEIYWKLQKTTIFWKSNGRRKRLLFIWVKKNSRCKVDWENFHENVCCDVNLLLTYFYPMLRFYNSLKHWKISSTLRKAISESLIQQLRCFKNKFKP